MSSGTPVGKGYMRQRHSQGYASGGDDLEDDASSRLQFLPSSPGGRSLIEVMENVVWIASALFIVYFGDRHSNLIFLLWHDERIRRIPLYIGMMGVGLNSVIFIYSTANSQGFRRLEEKWELFSLTALPLVTVLGIVSFCLFSFALWPIWSFLTLPLLFSLFMAAMVVFPHFVVLMSAKQNDAFRID